MAFDPLLLPQTETADKPVDGMDTSLHWKGKNDIWRYEDPDVVDLPPWLKGFQEKEEKANYSEPIFWLPAFEIKSYTADSTAISSMQVCL